MLQSYTRKRADLVVRVDDDTTNNAFQIEKHAIFANVQRRVCL